MIGRLERSADFVRVLRRTPRARTALFVAHHAPWEAPGSDLSTGARASPPGPVDDRSVPTLAGCVVPKRHARRAVTRSLVKRAIRGALARHETRLPPGLWVIRLSASIDRARYISAASEPLRRAMRAELDALITRALA